MRANKRTRKDARLIFRQCLEADGAIDDAKLRLVVKYLADNKPRGYLSLLTQLQRLTRLALAERTVHVESAVALDAAQEAAVQAAAKAQLGDKIVFHKSINPELLGGLRVSMGYSVYDGSVRGRLDQLQESFRF